MDAILKAINSIYETPLDEGSWDNALKQVCDLTGSAGFNVFVLDHEKEVIPVNRSLGIPDDIIEDYSSYYVQKDPGIAFYLRNPNEEFYYNYAHTSEAEIDKDEYYSWLQANGGARYYLATTFQFNDRYSGIVTAQRGAQAGHAQTRDMELLGQLSPHIQRAVELSELLDHSNSKAETALDALERAPYGVFLLDRDGDILFANQRARQILRKNDGLTVSDQRVVAARSEDNRHLQKAIEESLKAGKGETLFAGTSLPVETDQFSRPYMIRIAPLMGPSRLLMKQRPTVMLVVTDLDASADDIERRRDSLAALYGLTDAEAAIAVMLGEAMRPAEVCQQLRISENTLKTHRRHIFEKIGIETQAALAKIVTRL